MSTAVKFIAFGCTHAPLQDEAACERMLEIIAREQPGLVVHLGDGIESNAASQWDDAKEQDIPLEKEFDALNALLARVRKAAPRADRRYIAGNHESNVTRMGRIDKRLRSLIDWRNTKSIPELSHWTVTPHYHYSRHRGSYWFGPICFSHGYETTDSQAEVEAMYFLKNWPHSLYVCAHTHRPQPVRQIVWRGLAMDRWMCNAGCLRDLDPLYMERKRKWAWGHGVVVGEAMPLKSPRQAKEWEARVEVIGMFDGREAA